MLVPESEAPIQLYESRAWTKNSVTRLGRALAGGGKLDEKYEEVWRAFTGDALDRTTATTEFVRAVLRSNPVRTLTPRVAASEVTGRAKTRKTLVEKLQRTPNVQLPYVHDVAGVRVVGNFTLLEQAQAVRVLEGQLQRWLKMTRSPEVVDRLAAPSFGYRALHLVVWPEGRPVEIQIRTDLQHAWAEVMEVIGDRWGREPRYGLPVVYGDDQERDRRQSVVDSFISIARHIAEFEEVAASSGLAHINLPTQTGTQVERDMTPLAEAQRAARDIEPELEAAKQNLLRACAQFRVDAGLDDDR